MASPLTVTRNDYHKNEKNSTIYTPVDVAQFLFDILEKPMRRSIRPQLIVFDPAIGSGRLTDPWFAAGDFVIGFVIGCDIIRDPKCKAREFIKGKFEDIDEWNLATPDLVLCNSPFNGAPGKRLYPEVFLEHIFALFGVKVPVVLFAPMGCRLNQRRKSKRWRWLRDCGASITSIVSLPLDTFEGVEFHAEILIFNVPNIAAHYFLPETSL